MSLPLSGAMASSRCFLNAALTLTVAAAMVSADTIGIDYGRLGDNLPSPSQVVQLLQTRGVKHVRIYDTASDVLSAFANSGIDVTVTISNQEVPSIANDQSAADSWVKNNVQAFGSTQISYIAVGNEYLLDGSNDASKLVPAIQNIQRSVESSELSSIKVSTPHKFSVVGTSYPPSAGAFADSVVDVMHSLLYFLNEKNSPFMINIYPHTSYIDPSAGISLDYALFNPNAPTVEDSGRQYHNLFDAMLDAAISAMTRLGYGSLSIVITESGWPSAGGTGASIQNAQTYNNNLVKHVLSTAGTPLRPGKEISTYIFALFNEDQKSGDATEQNYGLYYPNGTAVYDTQLSVFFLRQNVSVLELQFAALATNPSSTLLD